MHAIGDLANREALDAFEATQDVWRPLGLRHRIEHAQLLADEDVARFAELGVAASVQFTHAVSDRDLADRFWAGESHRAYRWRALWDAGTLVANGSDAPIEELDPWAGVAAGVRKTWDDREPWHPEEAVTLDEALLATCVNPTFSRATNVAAGGSSPASQPTSSCSTATRTRSSPTHSATCRSSQRWSTAGGFTTRRRGSSYLGTASSL